jgi:hypothetical protein
MARIAKGRTGMRVFAAVRVVGCVAAMASAAMPAQGGTLCHNGKWRAFDGSATGTMPYRVFFKDGVFRGSS